MLGSCFTSTLSDRMLDRFTLRDVYGRWLRTRRPRALASSSTVSQSLPLDRLEQLVTQRGSERDRLRALDMLMSTPEGRQEFELMWAAASAVRRTRPRLRAPSWLVAAALCFAAGLGVWQQAAGVGAGPAGRAARWRIAAPTGVATREHRQHTGRSALSGVEYRRPRTYTMVIVDKDGKEVYASSTTGTEVKLPPSIHLDAGGTYLWWVQAELADGTQVSAVTETITVTE